MSVNLFALWHCIGPALDKENKKTTPRKTKNNKEGSGSQNSAALQRHRS